MAGLTSTLIAGALGAGASIYGASKQSKAQSKALQAERDANAGALAEQRAVTDRAYADTAQARQVGSGALSQLASRYGIQSPQQGSGQGGVDWAAYVNNQPDVLQYWQDVQAQDPGKFASAAEFGRYHDNEVRQLTGQGRDLSAYTPQAAQAPAQQPQQTVTQPSGLPTQIDAQGNFNAPARQDYTRPDIAPREVLAPRQTLQRQAVAPLDVSLDSYEQSPDYQFQLDEGNRNVLSNYAAASGVDSGAALKALQKYGQDLALGDYGQWRGYTTDNYRYGQNRADQNYQYDQNRSDQNYTYDANRADQNYNFGVTNQQNNFNTDRAFNTDLYNADRNYLTNRSDNYVNDLFRLNGLGTQASATALGAAQNQANTASNGYFSNAAAIGNAAQNQANIWSGLGGQLAGIGTGILGQYAGSRAAPTANNLFSGMSALRGFGG